MAYASQNPQRSRQPRGTRTREQKSFLGTLIAINVVVFIGWNSGSVALSHLMADHFLVSIDGVFSGRFWTLLTSCFSHMDASHLLFNMVSLFFFGREVQRIIGPKRFLRLYIIGGVIASIGHVLFSFLTNSYTPALGASGSVMAIAVIFGLLFPKRILYLNFFIPVPAGLAVLGFIVLDLMGALGGTGSGIAHAAHLGGAAYGLFFFQTKLRPRLRSRSTRSR